MKQTGQAKQESLSAFALVKTSLGWATMFFFVCSAIFVFAVILVNGDGSAPAITHIVLFLAQLPVSIFAGSVRTNPWAGIFVWAILVFLVTLVARLIKYSSVEEQSATTASESDQNKKC